MNLRTTHFLYADLAGRLAGSSVGCMNVLHICPNFGFLRVLYVKIGQNVDCLRGLSVKNLSKCWFFRVLKGKICQKFSFLLF